MNGHKSVEIGHSSLVHWPCPELEGDAAFGAVIAGRQAKAFAVCAAERDLAAKARGYGNLGQWHFSLRDQPPRPVQPDIAIVECGGLAEVPVEQTVQLALRNTCMHGDVRYGERVFQICLHRPDGTANRFRDRPAQRLGQRRPLGHTCGSHGLVKDITGCLVRDGLSQAFAHDVKGKVGRGFPTAEGQAIMVDSEQILAMSVVGSPVSVIVITTFVISVSVISVTLML